MAAQSILKVTRPVTRVLGLMLTRPLPPLFGWAARAGSKASVELYIRKGYDINSTDSKGRTLLLISAGRGHADICRLLIEAGANPSLRDTEGHDALSIAVKNRKSETEAVLRACLLPASVSPEDSAGADTRSSITDVAPAGVSAVLPVPADENLDLADWEELTEPPPPPDNQSLHSDARELQHRISSHVLVNIDEDWSDVEIDLPTIAELRNPDQIAWLDEIRDLIRFGLSCGWVTSDQLAQVVRDGGKEQDKADTEARLRIVLGDVGIPIEDDPDAVESISVRGPRYYSLGDGRNDWIVEDAVTFLGDLSRNGDHLIHYYADIKQIEAATVRMYQFAPRRPDLDSPKAR